MQLSGDFLNAAYGFLILLKSKQESNCIYLWNFMKAFIFKHAPLPHSALQQCSFMASQSCCNILQAEMPLHWRWSEFHSFHVAKIGFVVQTSPYITLPLLQKGQTSGWLHFSSNRVPHLNQSNLSDCWYRIVQSVLFLVVRERISFLQMQINMPDTKYSVSWQTLLIAILIYSFNL